MKQQQHHKTSTQLILTLSTLTVELPACELPGYHTRICRFHRHIFTRPHTIFKMADFHPDSIRNDTDSKTLSRLSMMRTKDRELVILLGAIQTACKLVARSVRKAGIAGLCKFTAVLFDRIAVTFVILPRFSQFFASHNSRCCWRF